MTADQWIALVAGIVGGALRVGAPFLFVSLGECLTEKSGRINLGLEGVLVLSAMAAFGGAYLTGSAWLGVLIGAARRRAAGAAARPAVLAARVNDVATGIALMLLGTGLAFYLGKPLIQPQAPQLPADPARRLERHRRWCARRCRSMRCCRSASCWRVAAVVGLRAHALAACWCAWPATRPTRRARSATRSTGIRIAATTAGGFIAGLGGASLTLFYPGSWNEGISSGQGLIAVALVIFARWSPLRCVGAALLFGGAGAIGPALQSIGVGWGYHLFNTVPYVLTLVILVLTCKPGSVAAGSPGELSSTR